MPTPTKADLEQELAERDALLDQASDVLDDEELDDSEKVKELETLLFDEE